MNPPQTAMDVFKMLPDATRAEVNENKLYIQPIPTSIHQEVSMALSIEIGGYIRDNKLGKFFATIDVYLDEENAFHPDLVFVKIENRDIIHENGRILGAPDLVIEILSPSNREYDLVNKKEIYERCAVNEYWVVDPGTKDAFGFLLEEEHYTELPPSPGKIKSKLLKKTFSF